MKKNKMLRLNARNIVDINMIMCYILVLVDVLVLLDTHILLDIVYLYLTQLSPRWLAWTPGPKRASSPPSAFSSQRRLGRDKFSSRLVSHTKDPIIEKTLEEFYR